MSKQKLRSHEDLSGYLESLNSTFNICQSAIRSTPSFSADPETIIEDLLSQLMESRKKVLEVVKIAKKFYKVYEDTAEEILDLKEEKNYYESEITELVGKIQLQAKEIEAKEHRIEIMTHESTEIEKDNRVLSQELQQLKKELNIYKNPNPKSTQQFRTSLIKSQQEMDELKFLKDSIEMQKQELGHKTAEIEEFQEKIKELQNLYNIEKTSGERVKSLYLQLKTEKVLMEEKIDDLEAKKSEQADQIESLTNELIKQKNYNDTLIREYDRERRKSSLFGFTNELAQLIEEENMKNTEENMKNTEENLKNNENPEKTTEERLFESKTEGSPPKYKTKAPKMENLAEIISEESSDEEEMRPKTQRMNTLFVLSSPVVNYEKKFNFGVSSKNNFEIKYQGGLNIIQSKFFGKPTFDLGKQKKQKQVFLFDDENGQKGTPIKNSKNFSISTEYIQAFPVKYEAKLCKTMSFFVKKQLGLSYCNEIQIFSQLNSFGVNKKEVDD